MRNGAVAIVVAFIVFGTASCHPAAAQSSIGGPKKQIIVGGAAKQNSPVVPVNKAAAIASVKQTAGVPPASQGPSIAASAPPQIKCAPGSCVAKGPR